MDGVCTLLNVNSRLTSGDYKPTVTKEYVNLGEAITGVPFPNWMRVLPEDVRKKAEINLADTGMGKNVKQTEKLSRTYSLFLKKTAAQINWRYIEDLLKTEWFVYPPKEKDKALMFKQKADPNGAYAIIMPFAA